VRFWRKLGGDDEGTHGGRGIIRRALAGASKDELCTEALRSVQPHFVGNVSRFGVWLLPESLPSGPSSLECFRGAFWDSDHEPPEEWNSLGSLVPLPPELLIRQAPFETHPEVDPRAAVESPKTGMRHLLWVPVLVEQQLRGLLFAASHKPHGALPREGMEQAASELAIVLSLEMKNMALRAAQQDLILAREVWSEASKTSLERTLLQIVSSALHCGAESRAIGPFAMIGLLPGRVFPQTPRDSPLEFRWIAGDKLCARAAMGEPGAAVWRESLEKGRTAAAEWRAPLRLKDVSRLIAIPVFVFGEATGVLVAALANSAATFPTVERLEFRARLVSVALTGSTRNESGGGALKVAEFFVSHTEEALFLLNRKLEITAASDSGKKLLALRPHQEIPDFGKVQQLFQGSESQQLAGALTEIAGAGAIGASHSIQTRLRTGRPARLLAAALPGGGLSLLVQRSGEPGFAEDSVPAGEFSSLIEWLDQGVLLFDENENIRAANLRFAQLFGLSSGELAQATNLRDLIELIAPRVSDPAFFAHRWANAAHCKESAPHEELQLLQPAPRLLGRFSRPIFGPAGTRMGRVEIYSDLTPQQLFQSKLRKSERLAAVGEQVSGIAHELSNPLTTILGYAQRLLGKSENSARREEIQRIVSEAERASSILRQLLGSTREPAPELHPVSLNALIQRTVDLQRFQLATEKIRVDLDLAPGLPPIPGDAGQLQQILMNLIANSRHAILEQQRPGSIVFRTRRSDSGRVVLEVSDSGPGIPEALRHRIFDPFFTTKAAGVGTGLGLSIVAGLVRQHGGLIRLQALADRGATFLLEFPSTSAEAPLLLPPALPAALSATQPVARGARALVVEDEPTVAQLIADMLSDLGYVPQVHHDARRALVSAISSDYALVVCDMKMPAMDGQHFFRALSEAGSPLVDRFLFVTGDVLGISTQEFLRQNRLPHIAKPFRVEEFTEKIVGLFADRPSSSGLAPTLGHPNLAGLG